MISDVAATIFMTTVFIIGVFVGIYIEKNEQNYK